MNVTFYRNKFNPFKYIEVHEYKDSHVEWSEIIWNPCAKNKSPHYISELHRVRKCLKNDVIENNYDRVMMAYNNGKYMNIGDIFKGEAQK